MDTDDTTDTDAPEGMRYLGLSDKNQRLARVIGQQLSRSLALRAEIGGEIVRAVKIDTALWVRNARRGDNNPSDALCFRIWSGQYGSAYVVVGIRSEAESMLDPMGEPADDLFVTVAHYPTVAQSMQHLQAWRGRFDSSGSLRLLAEFIDLVACSIVRVEPEEVSAEEQERVDLGHDYKPRAQ